MAPASKMTAKKRLLDPKYKAAFYVSPNFPDKLFCKACETTVEHSRPKTMDDHIRTAKHQRTVRMKGENQQRRQLTINDSVSSANLRDDITKDLVAMFAEADIPLNKISKVLPFLRKHAKIGGAIPRDESTLRRHHLPVVYQQHISAVREKLRGQKVFVGLDETTDARDKSVMNILAGEHLCIIN